jgi:hypothetical protein
LYFEYKEKSKFLQKMCDLLDIFAGVNREIVRRDDDKKKRMKSTSRIKVTKIFRDMTECLVDLEQCLREIQIKPVNGPDQTISSFYFGLGDFERLGFDSFA